MGKTNGKLKWVLKNISLDKLKPFKKNPRRMTEKGMKDLGRSLDNFGLAEPIVINKNTNEIIGGHARFYALQQKEINTADCYIPDRQLTEQEVKELNKKRKFKFCICEKCGNMFLNLTNGSRIKKYCSTQCLVSLIQEIRYCEYCNSQIIYNKKNGRTNKKFCSKNCAIKYRHEFGQSNEMKEKLSFTKRGKPLTKFHKEQLSKVKIGKPILHFINNKEEIRIKISKALIGKPQPWNRGELHPNYKDGGKAQWQRQKAMGRVEYKNWRREIYERDDYTCQICKTKGGKLQADHIRSWRDFPELRYCVDNGRTLCKDCHVKTKNYGGRKVA